MPFPPHIAQVLDAYAVRADTKAALYELYLAMGDEVLDVFADLAEGVTSAASLEPDDTLTIRAAVVERYLRRVHPRWIEGTPTASLWHPREAEGRASGVAVPLGEIPVAAQTVLPEGQSVPDGIVVLGRNAHSSGRPETISFDVVARDLDDALALARAAGQQHTLPGSAGETSGTFDGAKNVALIWEVQPNVYKPSGDRNREIVRLHGRHRNWHLVTLASALEWFSAQNTTVFILRGAALAATHEANAATPVSPTIMALHDRTVEQVVRKLDLTLLDPTDGEERTMLDSSVMNHSLRRHVLEQGAAGAIWRVDERSPSTARATDGPQ